MPETRQWGGDARRRAGFTGKRGDGRRARSVD